jgi:hypothetical protein
VINYVLRDKNGWHNDRVANLGDFPPKFGAFLGLWESDQFEVNFEKLVIRELS